MKKLDTPLIRNRATKQLSALGYKQVSRFVDKACEINKTHRLKPEGRAIADQVRILVSALIFDHNVTKEQLSELQRSIKIENGVLQLPSMS